MAQYDEGAVLKIDHGVVATNDLWKSIEFFTEVFGGKLNRLVNVNLRGLNREVPEMAFVNVANHPGWGLAIQPQPIPAPTRPMEGPTWGFEVDERGLEGVCTTLDEKNVAYDGPFDYAAPSPIARTIVVRDPYQWEYELTERRDEDKSDELAFGDLGLRRISHVRLEVTDLAEAEDWYTETLKLLPTDQVPGEAQLTLKTQATGQLFILREVEEMTQRSWYSFGPHVDIKVPIGDLAAFTSRLTNIERYWSPFPEKIPWHEPNMHTLYFYDPFGNRMQVSEDVPHT